VVFLLDALRHEAKEQGMAHRLRAGIGEALALSGESHRQLHCVPAASWAIQATLSPQIAALSVLVAVWSLFGRYWSLSGRYWSLFGRRKPQPPRMGDACLQLSTLPLHVAAVYDFALQTASYIRAKAIGSDHLPIGVEFDRDVLSKAP
jgi:hypothetical protein